MKSLLPIGESIDERRQSKDLAARDSASLRRLGHGGFVSGCSRRMLKTKLATHCRRA